jgi:tetratricopeptide (TPR) repeat protein
LAANQELAKQFPESAHSFLKQVICLSVLGRFDEADRLIEDRLKRIPDDLDAESSQILSLEFRGDFTRARALCQKIIDEGKADPDHLNRTAWESLFTGNVQPSDVENALKSVQLQDNNAPALHTLACLYIETGKTKQARDILIQAMDALDLDEPRSEYWYAFGRLAEQYGERDVAIADYLKVSKPESAAAIPTSCYRLAQIHLKGLQENK